MIEKAGIHRLAGGEAEVRAEQVIHGHGDEEVDVCPENRLERAFPPWALGAPAADDGQIESGTDDREMVDEEGDEGGMGEADGNRRGGQCLDRGREPPEVGQGGQQPLAGQQGEAADEGGDIAEVKREGAIKIRIAAVHGGPCRLSVGEGGEAEEREDAAGDALVPFARLAEEDQGGDADRTSDERPSVGGGEGHEGWRHGVRKAVVLFLRKCARRTSVGLDQGR